MILQSDHATGGNAHPWKMRIMPSSPTYGVRSPHIEDDSASCWANGPNSRT
jgi:hypothetical protein